MAIRKTDSRRARKAEPGAAAPDTVSAVLDRVYRERFEPIARALAASLGDGGAAVAEDAINDAACRALAVWPERGVPSDPAGWLFRVARNQVIDRLRRQNFFSARIA